ncbi:MAG: IPT/TIG domain-containing protein [Verrucomicrobiota bacterium]
MGQLLGAPVITDFSPAFAATGDPNYVHIHGTGLYPGLSGTLVVKFGNVPDPLARAVGDTDIQAEVPAAAPAGPCTITVIVNGLAASSLQDFVVVGPGPYIHDFSPWRGAGGVQVILNGEHFTGATSATFDGKPGTGLFAESDSRLQINAPGTVTTGLIAVTTPRGSYTSSSNFFVPPAITGFSPAAGPPGTNVVLTGANFLGATAVLLNGLPLEVTPTNNSTLQFTVPANATTGPIRLNAPAGSVTTASSFVVWPAIYSFSPTSGPPNTAVTVWGANFNAGTGTPTVRFNGVLAALQPGFTFSQLTAFVPAAAATGPISVTTSDGTAIGPGNFYLPPTISTFTPANGPAGTWVRLSGANFTDARTVWFNGLPAPSFVVTNNSTIGAMAPDDVTTGPLSLMTPGGRADSGSRWFYGAPSLSDFNPKHGLPGTNVTITGLNLLGATAVRFNGLAAGFTIAGNTTIMAAVPEGVSTGPITVSTPGGAPATAAPFVADYSDVALQVTVAPDPVPASSNLVYTITITNSGPYTAPNVRLSDTPPSLSNLVAKTTSQGSFTTVGYSLLCSLGDLNAGGSATITLTCVAPRVAGTLTNMATVEAYDYDPVAGNNSVTNLTRVTSPPWLTIQLSSSNQVLVSWPADLTNYLLQFNGALSANVAWSNVTAVPLVVTNAIGPQNVVTETNSNPARFYRLRIR